MNEKNSVITNSKVRKSKVANRSACHTKYIVISTMSNTSMMSIDITVSIVISIVVMNTNIEVEAGHYLVKVKRLASTSNPTDTTVTMFVRSMTIMHVNDIDRTVMIISIVDMIIDEVMREIVTGLNVMTYTVSGTMSVDDVNINKRK